MGSERVPGLAGSVEHRRIAVEHAMREEAFTQIEPDPLHGVEFGAVGRQREQRDVVRHGEPVRDMPAGLIEDERGMRAGLELLGEGFQK